MITIFISFLHQIWISSASFTWHGPGILLFIIWLGLIQSRRQILLSRSSVSGWMGGFVHSSIENVLVLFLCKLRVFLVSWSILICPSVKTFWAPLPISYFLVWQMLWTACQTQYSHKNTESDNCRLKVCSFHNRLMFMPVPTNSGRFYNGRITIRTTASLQASRSKLNFENRTITKENMSKNVKWSQIFILTKECGAVMIRYQPIVCSTLLWNV